MNRNVTNSWETGKALEYFARFIRNHNDSLAGPDFRLVAQMLNRKAWGRKLNQAFPEVRAHVPCEALEGRGEGARGDPVVHLLQKRFLPELRETISAAR